MARLTMMLFRDGHNGGRDGLGAILRDIVDGGAGHYSLTEIDVQHRPRIAARYNVQTTPTILLLQDGEVVDRIVGTPTTLLLHNLLDGRGAEATAASAFSVPPVARRQPAPKPASRLRPRSA
jgi:thioredoxin-like negative regulator of GroEL